MKIIDLSQNSPDWLEWRNCGLGSSDAPAILLGRHFQTTRLSLWKEKVIAYHGIEVDQKPPSGKFENPAMKRGKMLEGPTRDFYERLVGEKYPPVCGVHEEYPWLKVSLDGLNGNTAIEIKAPGVSVRDGSSDHYTALEGKVPEKYEPQLLHQALVSGVRRIMYVSRGHEDHFSTLDLHAIVEWKPEPLKLRKLFNMESRFWKCVVERRDPTTETWE